MNLDKEPHTMQSKNEITQMQPGTVDRDKEYGGRFWERLRDKKLSKEELAKERENLKDDIRRMAEQGEFRISMSGSSLSEQDKERLSAMRLLAQEMNLKVGGFYIDKEKGIAVAQVEKVSTQEEIRTKDTQELKEVREELEKIRSASQAVEAGGKLPTLEERREWLEEESRDTQEKFEMARLNAEALNDIASRSITRFEKRDQEYPFFGPDNHPEWKRNIEWVVLGENEIAQLQKLIEVANTILHIRTLAEPLWQEFYSRLQKMRKIFGTFQETTRIIGDSALQNIEEAEGSRLKVPQRIKELHSMTSFINELVEDITALRIGMLQGMSTRRFGERIKGLLSFLS